MRDFLVGFAIGVLIVLTCSIFSGCGMPELCPGVRVPANIYSEYELEPNTIISGIVADVPDWYGTERLERQVTAVTECMHDITMTDNMRRECWGEFNYPQCRDLAECAEIKIVADVRLSITGDGQQTLHDEAPEYDCRAKGFSGRCYWRAGIQHGYQIITTPQADLIGEPMVKLMTGCRFPYEVPELASCVDRSALVER